jgi:hypothetical protein
MAASMFLMQWEVRVRRARINPIEQEERMVQCVLVIVIGRVG